MTSNPAAALASAIAARSDPAPVVVGVGDEEGGEQQPRLERLRAAQRAAQTGRGGDARMRGFP